jgi:hypothetical protein
MQAIIELDFDFLFAHNVAEVGLFLARPCHWLWVA